ncbi:MAG: HAD family hydrolase [Candidatus Hinthialibacter antarcticus]|nr:HAD family hydrolase [Candidatus Hinthialibacter antarcticus]
MLQALIFDCDGVLVDTERDGHRVAFNQAFQEKGLPIEWDAALYGELLRVGGGKERMRHFFDSQGWPGGVEDRDAFILEMHKLKTARFMQIIESGQLPLRPGVKRIVDEAIAAGVTLAVCSTSNEKAVNAVVDVMLGAERKAKFAGIFAGDMAKMKKPDPEIYHLAKTKLNLDPAKCMVIEDSRNGLLAAKAADMNCLVTKSCYTHEEDFSEADAVFNELGDSPNINVAIENIQELVR